MLLTSSFLLASVTWALNLSFSWAPAGSVSYRHSFLNTYMLILNNPLFDSFVPFNNYPISLLSTTNNLFSCDFMALTAYPPPLLKLHTHRALVISNQQTPKIFPGLSFTLTFLQHLALQTTYFLERCMCTLDTQNLIKWLAKWNI